MVQNTNTPKVTYLHRCLNILYVVKLTINMLQVAAAISMHLRSANKQRLISKAIVGVNLETEVTPFSFAVQSGSARRRN